MALLVFTDLDGTLLDHHTYSFTAALPSIAQCQQKHIPIIINTSKSFVEVDDIQAQLGLNDPFIVENGAAIYFPKQAQFAHLGLPEVDNYWVKVLGQPRQQWINLLEQVKPKWGQYFSHFAALSVAEVQALTGLNTTQATQAKQREFGEPVHWRGTAAQLDTFISELVELGASPIMGGRFLHVCGATNKGMAITWLTTALAEHSSLPITTIGLGDGKNDIDMLETVDWAVQIKSPAYSFPPLQRQHNVIQTQGYGPAGWHEALQFLFSNTTILAR